MILLYKNKHNGGGSGIRTRDTVSRIHTFQACAFNHSATPPCRPCPLAHMGGAAKSPRETICSGASECAGNGMVTLASRRAGHHVLAMIRFLTRTMALLLLAAGFAALVVDGVRSISGSRIVVTAFGETIFRIFPFSFPKLQPAVEQRLHPIVWDPFLLSFFVTPTWLILGFLGLLLFWLTRRRPVVGIDPDR